MRLRHLPRVLAPGLALFLLSCGSETAPEVNDPPVVDGSPLPGGVVGAPYAHALDASGGDGTFVWEIMAGSLPAGLTLDPSGALSGTPTVADTSRFTVEATSGDGQSAAAELSIIVFDALTATTDSLADAVVGAAYADTLDVVGGDGTYTWALDAGALPDGLSLAPSGIVSGTPTAAGSITFSARVGSGDGQSVTVDVTITVYDPVSIETTDLPTGVVGAPWSATLAATGGDGSDTWEVVAGALPDGLTLAPSGVITGTPTAPDSAAFMVRVTTGDGQNATAELAIRVFEPLAVATPSLPPGVAGTAYTHPLTAVGGDGTYRWAVTAGALPDGLALDSLGVIAGTPTGVATAAFTIEVTSGDGQVAAVDLDLAVWGLIAITTDTLPTGVVGVPYAATFTASGGDGTLSWSVIDGALPDGLAFDSTGVLSGTPTAAGSATLTFEVLAGDGQSATTDLDVVVHDPVAISTTSLPTGVVGASYSQSLTATGGDGTYAWAITAGTLPDGLTLDPSGLLAGTPTAAANVVLTFSVTTGDGQTASTDLVLTTYDPVVISTTALPDAEVGVPYTQSITAVGGDGTYAWSVVSGGLPDGISLDASGSISGTATTAEGMAFTARVTTGDGQTADVALDLKAWKAATFVEGYAGANSIDRGETIELFTSTDGSEHVVRVYRMGWYGGDGRQLLLTVDSVPGVQQAVPTPDPDGLIEAGWTATYTLQTDPSWTSGVYIAELEAPTGDIGRILFVVRDDASPADLLVQIPVTTYQAYNNWGGKSLYDYNSTGGSAYKVSFDRPYADGAQDVWSRGASTTGGFFNGDYNLILWLEREGYTATYATSDDIERDASVLSGPSVFVSNFHDEYWSRGMRDNLVTAMDAGLHAAFFDSNNIYWQIRWEDSSGGGPYRVMVAYKDAGADPQGATADATVRWRDAPVSEPENELLGVMYASDYAYGTSYPWVVQNSGHWIYDGTSLADNDEIDGLVGYEFDRVWANGFTPAGLTVLAASPVVDGLGNADVHNASIYTRASGAIVFAAGTNYWSWFLDNTYKPNVEDARVQQMTRNLLSQMLGGG